MPEIQRARIVAALVEVSREQGCGMLTVARVVERSGVSRRTFYEFFDDCDACFIAAFEEGVRRAAEEILPVFQRESDWRERIRAALFALLDFLDREPALGGLCIVDALGASRGVLKLRAEVVGALVDAVHEGHREANQDISRLTAEGTVGGILAVLYECLAKHDAGATPHKPLIALLGPLMAMIVLPYLGPNAARRELAQPAPRAPRHPQRPSSNPLAALDMRLTYRTICVLAAIAATPGASNREIASTAGIHDQGQISKLLARLERLGLTTNSNSGPNHRGEPNAWQLTPHGYTINQAIHQHNNNTTS
jgi:AcrR family transcriptional regulator